MARVIARVGDEPSPVARSAPNGRKRTLGYRPELDGIRAIAVLVVIYFHCAAFFPGAFRLPGGLMGVDVFFVLSGYLITTLLVREARRDGDISLRHFYLRRALRLLPALVLAIVVASLVAWQLDGNPGDRSILEASIISLTFLSNWFEASAHLGLLRHTWSLGIEEQFYLVWPFVLMLIVRRGGSRRRTEVVLLACAVGAVVLRFSLLALGHTALGWRGTLSRADGVLLGSALAVALTKRGWFLRRVLERYWLGAAALVLLASAFYTCGRGVSANGCTAPTASLATAMLIGHLAVRPDGVIASALGVPPLAAIGRISYGLYLFHLPIVALIAHSEIEGPRAGLAVFALTVVVATLSFKLVERPFMDLYRRLATERTPEVRRLRGQRRLVAAG